MSTRHDSLLDSAVKDNRIDIVNREGIACLESADSQVCIQSNFVVAGNCNVAVICTLYCVKRVGDAVCGERLHVREHQISIAVNCRAGDSRAQSCAGVGRRSREGSAVNRKFLATLARSSHCGAGIETGERDARAGDRNIIIIGEIKGRCRTARKNSRAVAHINFCVCRQTKADTGKRSVARYVFAGVVNHVGCALEVGDLAVKVDRGAAGGAESYVRICIRNYEFTTVFIVGNNTVNIRNICPAGTDIAIVFHHSREIIITERYRITFRLERIHIDRGFTVAGSNDRCAGHRADTRAGFVQCRVIRLGVGNAVYNEAFHNLGGAGDSEGRAFAETGDCRYNAAFAHREGYRVIVIATDRNSRVAEDISAVAIDRNLVDAFECRHIRAIVNLRKKTGADIKGNAGVSDNLNLATGGSREINSVAEITGDSAGGETRHRLNNHCSGVRAAREIEDSSTIITIRNNCGISESKLICAKRPHSVRSNITSRRQHLRAAGVVYCRRRRSETGDRHNLADLIDIYGVPITTVIDIDKLPANIDRSPIVGCTDTCDAVHQHRNRSLRLNFFGAGTNFVAVTAKRKGTFESFSQRERLSVTDCTGDSYACSRAHSDIIGAERKSSFAGTCNPNTAALLRPLTSGIQGKDNRTGIRRINCHLGDTANSTADRLTVNNIVCFISSD